MKKLDVLAAALVVIGGFNWGLVERLYWYALLPIHATIFHRMLHAIATEVR